MESPARTVPEPDRVAEAVTYLAEKKKQGEYTISDYYAIPEDVRAELIDGVIYDMAPPLSVHQLLSAKIHGYLARYIEKKGGSCIPFFAPIGVQLDKDDKTIVEPDILIVCDRNQITRRGIYGAPDFVIEILSESTKKKDSYLKLMKYQNAGVREYWLVDPEKKKFRKSMDLIRRFQLEYLEENVRWILLKFMKKSDLYMREKKNRTREIQPNLPHFDFIKSLHYTLKDVN